MLHLYLHLKTMTYAVTYITRFLGIIFLALSLASCGIHQNLDDTPFSSLLSDNFECADANFSYADKKDISIQILGDSTFRRGTNCGSINDVLLKFTSLSQVYNNSISSGEILNDGYKSILKRYDANVNTDYIIISGGGVDLWKCGEELQCHKKTASLIHDKITDFVVKNRIKSDSIIFTNHSRVANSAPISLRLSTRSGGANEIRKMYRALEAKFDGSIYVDLTILTGTTDPEMWEKDGYHPTTEAYKRLIVHLLNSGRF